MYNEELKQEFIKGYTSNTNTSNNCVWTFNSIESIETELDTDVSAMSVENLQRVVNGISTIRKVSKDTKFAIIREYIRWCVNTGKPGAIDNTSHIDLSNTQSIRKHLLANPTHLELFLNAVLRPVSEKTIDDTFRCYYWMAFSGIKEEDLLTVRASDVSLADLNISLNNGSYQIYPESIEAFRHCIELTAFVLQHPNYSDKILPRLPGDLLLRGVRKENNILHMRSELSRKNRAAVNNGKTTSELSYYRVWLSGWFYRTYEFERALPGNEFDFSELTDKYMEGRKYNLSANGLSIEGKRQQIMRGFKHDYEAWKSAF